jgi:hypothetical protein
VRELQDLHLVLLRSRAAAETSAVQSVTVLWKANESGRKV